MTRKAVFQDAMGFMFQVSLYTSPMPIETYEARYAEEIAAAKLLAYRQGLSFVRLEEKP